LDPREFLNLADELRQRNGVEAALRTAVSRSYYALYNRLHQEISAVQALPTTPDAHQLVVTHVSRCRHVNLQRVGTHLQNLKAERIRADYRIGTVLTEGESAVSVANAQKAFALLDALSAAELQGQLRAALR
jgi:hypothetical protein